MQELIKKIEQWAEDRNIIKGSKPIDQAMKLFSEFGELADNVGKGRDCRDDIGDCAVVATIICRQMGSSIQSIIQSLIELEKSYSENNLSSKDAVLWAIGDLSSWAKNGFNLYGRNQYLTRFLEGLMFIANKNGYTIEECVQIAYDDIKHRKGVMYNGVFIKESDPAYQDILDNIEADKRMATQKRISVNIEDL